ncbi:uncharacterized protein B0I36DRAFT_367453 [Microdochium trichocladiopsis]|uniref:Copper acquisition factor BIM1-like domain-containing protein n=1 Tax=Microdochium trichocladiopsis TaxID=1682393 RepID=A0A9P8XVM0_9PEZI|nr:uncharacterized protein B0I36DRAFT_367453 [Microdochium trichocladiopsis]KAH7020990.1 hypothetical protein B0I36DRAFT_367453 [Microdochium trichocladiopsis]
MLSRTVLSGIVAVLVGSVVDAHTAIKYPGSRGDNFGKNGTVAESDGLGIFTSGNDSDPIFPYGMTFIYPCGGLPTSTNRTLWPLNGPVPLILEPGHQANHDWGMIWVNIGLGTIPTNFTTQMMHEFSFTFPSDGVYDNQICLPEVTLPSAVRNLVSSGQVKAGDNATIQVVESAKHGGALYSCIDITFTAATYPSVEVPDVTTKGLQCTNDTNFQFGNVTYGQWSAEWSGDGYSKDQSLALGLGLGLPLIAIVLVLGYFLWRSRRLNKRYEAAGLAVGIKA